MVWDRAVWRACWLWLHKWLGLTAGMVLVLMGLSGSVSVFTREIDALLNPALFTPSGVAGTVSAAQVWQAAEAASTLPVRSLQPPDEVWPVWVVRQSEGPGRGAWLETMIDPGSGEILGSRQAGTSFAALVYRFHHDLLLGDFGGRQVVGYSGLVLLISLMTGLYLWWPRPGRLWRSVSIRRSAPRRRLLLDIHNVAAMWPLLPLLVVAMTGVTLSYPQTTRWLLGVEGGARPGMMGAPARDDGALAVGPDQALAAALAAQPNYRVTQMMVPMAGGNPVWRLQLRHRDADPAVRARGSLTIDANNGAVRQVSLAADMGWAARYLGEQKWLHGGATFGLAGRIVMSLAGLAPLVLFVTGFLVWRHKRASRRAAAALPVMDQAQGEMADA